MHVSGLASSVSKVCLHLHIILPGSIPNPALCSLTPVLLDTPVPLIPV